MDATILEFDIIVVKANGGYCSSTVGENAESGQSFMYASELISVE